MSKIAWHLFFFFFLQHKIQPPVYPKTRRAFLFQVKVATLAFTFEIHKIIDCECFAMGYTQRTQTYIVPRTFFLFFFYHHFFRMKLIRL